MLSLSGGFTVCPDLVLYRPRFSGCSLDLAGDLGSGLSPGGWSSALAGGSTSLGGDLATAMGTLTAVGLLHRNLLCLAWGATLCVGIHRLWCCFWRYTIEVLSLLSGRFLVSRSCYGGQLSERAGLIGVIPGFGLLSGCNSDHSAPTASSYFILFFSSLGWRFMAGLWILLATGLVPSCWGCAC